MSSATKYRVTGQALQIADAALVNYVMLTRGLPCPANGAAGDGVALASCPNPVDQTNGVVPWTTLGIPQTDVTDGFGNLITYRVASTLVGTDGMNLSKCDPAGTFATAPTSAPYCDAGCTNGNLASCNSTALGIGTHGLKVQGVSAVANDPATQTGAAYVLISHGPNLARAYAAQGGYTQDGSAGASGPGTNEIVNGVNQPLQAVYYDTAIDTSDTITHFDDALRHPTILDVASRAALAPRSH
jgi:hypothetical protein